MGHDHDLSFLLFYVKKDKDVKETLLTAETFFFFLTTKQGDMEGMHSTQQLTIYSIQAYKVVLPPFLWVQFERNSTEMRNKYFMKQNLYNILNIKCNKKYFTLKINSSVLFVRQKNLCHTKSSALVLRKITINHMLRLPDDFLCPKKNKTMFLPGVATWNIG